MANPNGSSPSCGDFVKEGGNNLSMTRKKPSEADRARGQRISALMDALGLTHLGVANGIGVTESAVSQWAAGATSPKPDKLPKLAEILRTSVSHILTGSEPVRHSDDAPDISAALKDAPRNVPVLGAVPGGPEGSFIMDSNAVTEYLPRPPGIASLKEVYGLYIVGDSMKGFGSSEGDIIYVSRTRPPVVGGLVVVQLKDDKTDETVAAMVKQYMGRTATHLKLAQFNPAKEFQVALVRVEAVHRVLTLRELMGA